MTINHITTSTEGRDLVLTRTIDAPPDKVYQAWANPELLKQWFAPLPWTTPEVRLDVRAGGSTMIVMRSPEGVDFPNQGTFLEVVENERLVFTDAYVGDWEPSETPFITSILTFEERGGKTQYTARVRHWTVADREKHEAMGFFKGWSQCMEQLAALVEQQ